MVQIDSSFRDPSGFVFLHNNAFYRQVNLSYENEYNTLMSSGLYEELTHKKMLIAHTEVSAFTDDSKQYKTIKPTQIPYISYPYEWSFSQYKAAAALTLDICMKALEKNMILKDASSYNVQFIGGNPIFIDTLSFACYKAGQTWDGYGQFCRHFLAPLVLMAKRSPALAQLMRVYIDGIPLDLAASLLPCSCRLSMGLNLHIYMHGKKQNDRTVSSEHLELAELPKTSLMAILQNLKSIVMKAHMGKNDTEWGSYYESMLNYSNEAFANKAKLIEQYLNQIDAHFVCDMGANSGEFSKVAGKRRDSYVVAYDIDHTAVDKHYNALRANQIDNILPLILDLTNPSPAIGFANKERMNVQERASFDCTLALALIHHLAISNNLPFEKIAEYFNNLSQHLIIEFVPKGDSQVEKLLLNREDIFAHYTREDFEQSFSTYFEIINSYDIEDSQRVLYLMKAR